MVRKVEFVEGEVEKKKLPRIAGDGQEITKTTAFQDMTRGKFWVDASRIPEDTEYRWVLETANGVDQENNLQKKQMAGFTPVPADRHPELVIKDYRVGEGRMKAPNYVRRLGHILMERDKVVGKEYRAALQQRNEEEIRKITEFLQGDANPLAKNFFVDHNEVSRTHARSSD